MSTAPASTTRLTELVEELLHKNLDDHERAMEALAEEGDERVVPHLVEIAQIDAVANNWETFGHPEILRERQIPYPLNHPEVHWPGVYDTLSAIAEPAFDSEYAWLQWETWATQQDIDPLPGFMDWKIRLFRMYHPAIGHLLDTEPRMDDETFRYVRGAVADPTTLHPLNTGTFRPSTDEEYVAADDLVYGFHIEGQAYAVPRWIILPHEGMNMTLQGVPVSLSYCPLCDTFILFDREVGGHTLTLGCCGLLLHGNKIMFDDETASLWAQVTGEPIAGQALEEGWSLERRPVDQSTWGEWRESNPDTYLLDRDTGYDWEYEWYQNYDGYMKRHYWEREEIILPGMQYNETPLSDNEHVYALETDGGSSVRVYPISHVHSEGVVQDSVDGEAIVVVPRGTMAAVYEAPSGEVERDGETLLDGDGVRWTITQESLESESGTLPRRDGVAGMWWAMRPKYDEFEIIGLTE